MSNPLKFIKGNKSIAGVSPGEKLLLIHTTGKINTIILDSFDINGITGFNVNLSTKPLTFYPFHNILEIKKTE